MVFEYWKQHCISISGVGHGAFGYMVKSYSGNKALGCTEDFTTFHSRSEAFRLLLRYGWSLLRFFDSERSMGFICLHREYTQLTFCVSEMAAQRAAAFII